MAGKDPECSVPEMVSNIAVQVRITMKKLRETLKPVQDIMVKHKLSGVYGELKDLERTLGSLNSALTWSEHIGVPAVRTSESIQDLREAINGCWDTCKEVSVLVTSNDKNSMESLLQWSEEMPVRAYREALAGILKLVMETAYNSDSESDLDDRTVSPAYYDEKTSDGPAEDQLATVMEALAVSVSSPRLTPRLSTISIPKPALEIPLAPIQEDDQEADHERPPSAVSPLSTPCLGLNIYGFDPLDVPQSQPKDEYFTGELVSPMTPVSSLFNSPASTIFRSSSKSSSDSANDTPDSPTDWDEGKIPLSSELPLRFTSPSTPLRPDTLTDTTSLWTHRAYFFFPPLSQPPTFTPPLPAPPESTLYTGTFTHPSYILTKAATSTSLRSPKRRYTLTLHNTGTSTCTTYRKPSSLHRAPPSHPLLNALAPNTFHLHNHPALSHRRSQSLLPTPRPSFPSPREQITLTPLPRTSTSTHTYPFARFTHRDRLYLCHVGFVSPGRIYTQITEYRHSIAALDPTPADIDPADADADRKYIATVVSFCHVTRSTTDFRNVLWVRKCMRENLETLLILLQAHFGYVALKYAVGNMDAAASLRKGKAPGGEAQEEALSWEEKVAMSWEGGAGAEEVLGATIRDFGGASPSSPVAGPAGRSPVGLRSPGLKVGPSGFQSTTTYC